MISSDLLGATLGRIIAGFDVAAKGTGRAIPVGLEARIREGTIDSCHRALGPGAWSSIIDETCPSIVMELRQPKFLFPVQTGLEEPTWCNALPTREEQGPLLRKAVFQGELRRAAAGEGFAVLSTQKPS